MTSSERQMPVYRAKTDKKNHETSLRRRKEGGILKDGRERYKMENNSGEQCYAGRGFKPISVVALGLGLEKRPGWGMGTRGKARRETMIGNATLATDYCTLGPGFLLFTHLGRPRPS